MNRFIPTSPEKPLAPQNPLMTKKTNMNNTDKNDASKPTMSSISTWKPSNRSFTKWGPRSTKSKSVGRCTT